MRLLSAFLISGFVNSCATGFGARGPGIRLYSIELDDSNCPVDKQGNKEAWCKGKRGGYRPVDKEVLAPEKMSHWIAIDPDQFDLIIHACPH